MLYGLGPQFTFKLTWHQEVYDATAKSYKVIDFLNNAGFSGDAIKEPNRGR